MYTAQDVLDVHWDGSIPVDVVSICKDLGINISEKEDLNCISRFEMSNPNPVITCKKNTEKKIINFALAHAVAHYSLGHMRIGDVIQENSTNFSSNTAEEKERQANIFALELLIPKNTLKYLIEQKGILKIDELSNMFNVSEVAMKARLYDLNFIPKKYRI